MAFTLVLFLSLVCTSFSGILSDENVRPIIQSTIACRFDHRYAKADTIIDSLRLVFPNDPAPLFLKGSNLHDKMTHYEDYSEIFTMNCILDSAITLASENLVDPWNFWIIGSSLGYKAMAEIESGNYFSAYNTSREALDYLKTAMDSQETRADAALGAGGYYYWVSRSLGFLTYLPLVPDNREEGLELLRTAFTESHYSRDAAAHALVYIFCKSEEFDSARAYSCYIEEKYPSSLLPLWYKLSIAEALKDLSKYLVAAESLSCALDTLGIKQGANAIEIHYFSAIAAKDLKLWDRAIFHCDKALDFTDNKALFERFEDELHECKTIREYSKERMAQ
ncbi:hypothetical protein KAH81_06210 [bacterium]|nr:hypothetical protein [bacterium]